MRRVTVLSAAMLAAMLAVLGAVQAVAGSALTPQSVVPDPPSGGYIITYVLNVTLAYGAPSCFARPIVLVSGLFEPTITINKGDTLRIVLINNIPANAPTVSDGISIHYHGLHMKGPAAWFDGATYLELCPVGPGRNYTYQFQVNDPPGSYLWHDHSTGFKGDGLQGALVVLPPRAAPPPAGEAPGAPPPPFPPPSVPDLWAYDGDQVLFLSDWYHASMNSLMMQLNMPFDSAKVTNDSGAWAWIGNPQAILVNGAGFYGDCPLFPGGGANAVPPTCAPTTFTVPAGRSAQQPWASSNNPGCTHSQVSVESGKTYRLRIISSSTLVYMTVCFDSHNVTLIAADGIPISPVSLRCLDVNSGQRIDVLLTADQPAANYWISVAAQYRVGSPAGYAVLSYSGAPAATFPATPAPQPANMTAWGYAEDSLINMASELLVPSTSPAVAAYRDPGQATLAPPKAADKFVLVNLSQPLLPNGQLRWALDNVVTPRPPPCKPLLANMVKNPRFLKSRAVNASLVNGTAAGVYVGLNTIPAESFNSPAFVEGLSPIPVYPSVGLKMVELNGSTVVDVVVNNNPANSFNGDYRPAGAARTAMEQHPFHLHGHRFWVLGRGSGIFNATVHGPGLNTANPAYRDTVTIAAGGWAYIRFVANNPGIWPFHCHILPHVYMGQQLYFVEDLAHVAPPPPITPKCPGACRYNFAPFNKAFLREKWGASGFEVPPL